MEGMCCERCGREIPDTKRRGTKFCRDRCRVAYHLSQPVDQVTVEDLDIRLSPIEAGLLIDAAVPWIPNLLVGPRQSQVLYNHENKLGRKPTGAEWEEARSTDRSNDARTLKVRKAARRLIALGLARGGMAGRRMVIERTEIGSVLLARRHNELHAIAEHVGEAAPEFVWWQRKRSTRTHPEWQWPQIDGRWFPLVADIFQVTVFRRAFMYGTLARFVPVNQQYEIVKGCVGWHRHNKKPMTQVSIRDYLDAALKKILSSPDQPKESAASARSRPSAGKE